MLVHEESDCLYAFFYTFVDKAAEVRLDLQKSQAQLGTVGLPHDKTVRQVETASILGIAQYVQMREALWGLLNT